MCNGVGPDDHAPMLLASWSICVVSVLMLKDPFPECTASTCTSKRYLNHSLALV